MLAIQSHLTEVAISLIKYLNSSKVDEKDNDHSWTALHYAVYYDNLTIVRELHGK
jgi:hypothetical protein